MTGVDTGGNGGTGVGIAVGEGVFVADGEIVTEGFDVDTRGVAGEGNDVEVGSGSGETVVVWLTSDVIEFLMTIVAAGASDWFGAGPYVP